MLRLVIDTCVLTSGVRSTAGASYQVLMALERGAFTALASTALFLEYEAVLKRPEQLSALALDLRDIDELLAQIAVAVEPVSIHVNWRPQLRDPNDEFVLEAAINGRTDAIVTYNLGDFGPASRFGIWLMPPSALLGELHR